MFFGRCYSRAHHRPEAVAALDDIRRLREAVQQVSDMEIELGRLGSAVSGRSIELKSTIKKRLSSPTMLEVPSFIPLIPPLLYILYARK